MLTLVSLLIFAAVLGWKLNDNLKRWNGGNPLLPVPHRHQWLIFSRLLSPSVIMLAIPLAWWAVFITAPMLAFWFWLLFDGLYNRLRRIGGKRLPFFYTGSTDSGIHQDAGSDSFLKSLDSLESWLSA